MADELLELGLDGSDEEIVAIGWYEICAGFWFIRFTMADFAFVLRCPVGCSGRKT